VALQTERAQNLHSKWQWRLATVYSDGLANPSLYEVLQVYHMVVTSWPSFIMPSGE